MGVDHRALAWRPADGHDFEACVPINEIAGVIVFVEEDVLLQSLWCEPHRVDVVADQVASDQPLLDRLEALDKILHRGVKRVRHDSSLFSQVGCKQLKERLGL